MGMFEKIGMKSRKDERIAELERELEDARSGVRELNEAVEDMQRCLAAIEHILANETGRDWLARSTAMSLHGSGDPLQTAEAIEIVSECWNGTHLSQMLSELYRERRYGMPSAVRAVENALLAHTLLSARAQGLEQEADRAKSALSRNLDPLGWDKVAAARSVLQVTDEDVEDAFGYDVFEETDDGNVYLRYLEQASYLFEPVEGDGKPEYRLRARMKDRYADYLAELDVEYSKRLAPRFEWSMRSLDSLEKKSAAGFAELEMARDWPLKSYVANPFTEDARPVRIAA